MEIMNNKIVLITFCLETHIVYVQFLGQATKHKLAIYEKKCIGVVSRATDNNTKMDKYKKIVAESRKKICHFVRSRKHLDTKVQCKSKGKT